MTLICLCVSSSYYLHQHWPPSTSHIRGHHLSHHRKYTLYFFTFQQIFSVDIYIFISTPIFVNSRDLVSSCNDPLPSGPPEPPQGCSASVGKARTLDIDCRPGFDGGLPQEFILSLVNTITGTTVINKTAIIPTFSFKGGLISRAVSEPSRSCTDWKRTY